MKKNNSSTSLSKIQVFNHELFGDIRILSNDEGETFFVGKDVAKALGYDQTDKAIQRHVEEDDRMKCTVTDKLGRAQQTVVINESGLYALVLSSKLPQAKKFKQWVTSEVLPQIRRTGGYIPTHDSEGRQLTDMEIMCLALQIQQRTIDEQHKTIEVMEPKAEYCDEVLDSVSCLTTTQIAKELNMTAQELNLLLCQRGIQYGQSGQYLLYAPYARRGLARNRTHSYRDLFGDLHTRTQLVWTERGRNFIHKLFN